MKCEQMRTASPHTTAYLQDGTAEERGGGGGGREGGGEGGGEQAMRSGSQAFTTIKNKT